MFPQHNSHASVRRLGIDPGYISALGWRHQFFLNPISIIPLSIPFTFRHNTDTAPTDTIIISEGQVYSNYKNYQNFFEKLEKIENLGLLSVASIGRLY